MVAEWWEGHGWSPVPQIFLPKLGVIAYVKNGDDKTDLAAAWLYMDNSVGVSILEWMVANPKASAIKCVRGINAISNYLQQAAKSMNYAVMLTTCKQESLGKLHERNGFQKTDTGMTHFVKGLL